MNTILFFRLGDFYEMFFEDAALASRILNITLTGREGGEQGRIPMCGFPYHSAKNYISKLIEEGYKVAICEQVGDPRASKGLVKREVTRIISQGTYVEESEGEISANRYLVSCFPNKTGSFGLAYLDLGTGEFKLTEVTSINDLKSELMRVSPVEAVLPESLDSESELGQFLQKEFQCSLNHYEPRVFDVEKAVEKISKIFQVKSIDGLGLKDYTLATSAVGAILYYLEDHLHKSLEHIKRPQAYSSEEYMVLDSMTQRNLELADSLTGDKKAPTLLSSIDETKTPMGGRMLRLWLKRPLLQKTRIEERLGAVKELTEEAEIRVGLREALHEIRDIERIVSRLNCNLGNARDLVALKVSLSKIPTIKQVVKKTKFPFFKQLNEKLFELKDFVAALENAFLDQPAVTVKDGGLIKEGYNSELDELRNISAHGKDYIAQLQKKEIERTGIKSLKIKYNKVFGYYIEISKTNLDSVPEEYIRKQTLVNAERFIIPELKEYEDKVLNATEKSNEKEFEIFEFFRSEVKKQLDEIQSSAESLGSLDVLASFAEVAVNREYVCPEVTEEQVMKVTGARHPVVEMVLPAGEFVENDILLDQTDHQLILITGPNMAGKSTYIRQVALVALLAQIGSFVPAQKATIGICDRIFTRIGASDFLTRGESTFMVEMIETANILNNATEKSLIVMDEIGRGTSTYDGVSIAWSVCEHLAREDGPKPRTLFATHYHELTELENLFPTVKNYNVTVDEREDAITFLRKIVRGGTDKSYGIHVAKLAGLPEEVIARSHEILEELEKDDTSQKGTKQRPNVKKIKKQDEEELPLFS